MSFKVIKQGQYAYKRTGKLKDDYRVIFRQNGVNLNKKLLGVKDAQDALLKARAEVVAAENQKKREDLLKDQIRERSPLVRFETIMDQVIESKPVLSTRKTTEYFLKRCVLPILNKHCPFVKDFGPTACEDFVTWYQNERPGEKLFNPRKYFLQVLKRAKKLGLLDSRVVIEIKNPDPKRAAGKVYSDDEISRLFENADGDLLLQLLMAYSMGMRKSEILKLRWDRLNLFRETIALRAEDTKIRRGREFKVNNTVWTLLLARYKVSKSPCLFPSPKDDLTPIIDNKTAWARCKRDAQVTGRFHDLRHTFLTNEVARKKHQAIDVCVYAGLSLEELRNTYLHPTFQDTAYIAENQDRNLNSLLTFCNRIRNTSTGGTRYA